MASSRSSPDFPLLDNHPRAHAFRSFYQTGLSLNKRFSTPVESLKVEFRTEAYNLLNHTNLYLPSAIGSTPGAPAATTGGLITSTCELRIIQFGLKILYERPGKPARPPISYTRPHPFWSGAAFYSTTFSISTEFGTVTMRPLLSTVVPTEETSTTVPCTPCTSMARPAGK